MAKGCRAKYGSRNGSQIRADAHPLPQPFGLFDPTRESDACGVGFIADIKGKKSHKIVEDALTILLNLEHRGAVGAD
ncbi:MAG TPA: hypothetical protein VN930_02605, partial [Xanthobacteraceae bacterium]|nr:hypothetical protein [Xanthobacteraceae bacterium]